MHAMISSLCLLILLFFSPHCVSCLCHDISTASFNINLDYTAAQAWYSPEVRRTHREHHGPCVCIIKCVLMYYSACFCTVLSATNRNRAFKVTVIQKWSASPFLTRRGRERHLTKGTCNFSRWSTSIKSGLYLSPACLLIRNVRFGDRFVFRKRNVPFVAIAQQTASVNHVTRCNLFFYIH